MAEAFVFVRHGRARRTVLVLMAVYAGLTGLVLVLDAAWWVVGLAVLLTIPALWDLYRDPSAGVRLDDTRLEWHSGRRSASLPLDEIDHMRFDTRWDFSVRVSVVTGAGKRVHLPFEAVPPHRQFETAFESRGIAVKRSHFSFF
jgi:hypothetical protein